MAEVQNYTPFINPIQSNIETFKVLMFLENKNIRLGKYSPLCYKDKPKHVRHINHYKKFITTYKKYTLPVAVFLISSFRGPWSLIKTRTELFKCPCSKRDLKNCMVSSSTCGKYSPLCYKDKPKHVRHINHYKKFITTYKKYRKFAFSWLTEISHEFMNFLEHVDEDTMQFFKSLFEQGHLNNSITVCNIHQRFVEIIWGSQSFFIRL
jgi:hypothetical protein